jgi:formamidopyrimidine-DNA glycosylase
MPEGPEVKIVTDWLRSRYAGVYLDPIHPLEMDRNSRYVPLEIEGSLHQYVLSCYGSGFKTYDHIPEDVVKMLPATTTYKPLVEAEKCTLEMLHRVASASMEARRLIGYDLLFGWKQLRIQDVICRGKKIFFVIQAEKDVLPSNTTNTEVTTLYICSSLGLEGKWVSSMLHSSVPSPTDVEKPENNKVKPGKKRKEKVKRIDPKHSNLWLNLYRAPVPTSQSPTPLSQSPLSQSPTPLSQSPLSQLHTPLSQSPTIPEVASLFVSETLFYNDVRHMGEIRILNQEKFEAKWNSLGHDLLSETISPGVWMECISRPRLRNKQICDFLMSQQYFSGIGNYLKAEILYAARIRPDRCLGELTEAEKQSLLHHSQKIIRFAYQEGGLTIRSFYHPDGTPGTFDTLVYGKATDPHGHAVIQSTFKDNRSTHWCPTLQH